MRGDDFFWGAGASSVAIEGAGLRSDWFRWEDERNLGASASGNNFREQYLDDFALFAEHGLRQVRLTLEWARIEPFPGQYDDRELEHIETVLLAARDAGLSVWATLHHGSLPGWFAQDTDGFCTAEGASIHWSRHVDMMAERFDPLVAVWWPVEDPIGWALASHHHGQRPPGTRSVEKGRDAVHGILDATFDAHRLLSSGDNPVVASFGARHIVPSVPEARTEARFWDQVVWGSWARAISEGILELPWAAAIERPDMADAFDAVGISITAPLEVDTTGNLAPWPADAARDGAGETPEPGHLGETLQRAAELLNGKDLFVSRLGTHTEDERWRATLLEGWLEQVATARADGLPVRGVFLEPVIDGYDVEAGRHLDGGVFSRSREPKPSFAWIAAQQ